MIHDSGEPVLHCLRSISPYRSCSSYGSLYIYFNEISSGNVVLLFRIKSLTTATLQHCHRARFPFLLHYNPAHTSLVWITFRLIVPGLTEQNEQSDTEYPVLYEQKREQKFNSGN
jgi:hypothetical protein